MRTVETEVARHYTLSAIESRIDEALRTAGKDPEHLGPDDLAPLDEFWAAGLQRRGLLADLRYNAVCVSSTSALGLVGLLATSRAITAAM